MRRFNSRRRLYENVADDFKEAIDIIESEYYKNTVFIDITTKYGVSVSKSIVINKIMTDGKSSLTMLSTNAGRYSVLTNGLKRIEHKPNNIRFVYNDNTEVYIELM